MKPKILTLGKTVVNLIPTYVGDAQVGVAIKMIVRDVSQFESVQKYIISEGFLDGIPKSEMIFYGKILT